ncbi:MAG: hypothetical protein VW555_07050, partial [Luminiphilus sp.]
MTRSIDPGSDAEQKRITELAVRWRIAILLAVITTINYVDRSVFGVVAPVVRGEFGIGDADYGLITSGFL